MKTKILFFITSLEGGGAEKVLVNMVNNMDQSKYDITVQTLFDTGINKQYLKDTINYKSVSYTHLTLPTIHYKCRSRWSPYH